MLLNILIFVGLIYLIIQIIRDAKEILKDDNEYFN